MGSSPGARDQHGCSNFDDIEEAHLVRFKELGFVERLVKSEGKENTNIEEIKGR